MAKFSLYHPRFQYHRLLWDSFAFGSYKRQCVVDWFPVNLCCYYNSQAGALTFLFKPVFVVGGKGWCGRQKVTTVPVAKPWRVDVDLGASLAPRSYLTGFQSVYQKLFIQTQEFVPDKANPCPLFQDIFYCQIVKKVIEFAFDVRYKQGYKSLPTIIITQNGSYLIKILFNRTKGVELCSIFIALVYFLYLLSCFLGLLNLEKETTWIGFLCKDNRWNTERKNIDDSLREKKQRKLAP